MFRNHSLDNLDLKLSITEYNNQDTLVILYKGVSILAYNNKYNKITRDTYDSHYNKKTLYKNIVIPPLIE